MTILLLHVINNLSIYFCKCYLRIILVDRLTNLILQLIVARFVNGLDTDVVFPIGRVAGCLGQELL